MTDTDDGARWTIQTDGSALSADKAEAVVALRLGLICNAIRSAQSLYDRVHTIDGPEGMRERYFSFLIGGAYLYEAIQAVGNHFAIIRQLAMAGGLDRGHLDEFSGQLQSGRSALCPILHRLRNNVGFHWDQPGLERWIDDHDGADVVWADGSGDINRGVLYRAAYDAVMPQVIPVLPGESDEDHLARIGEAIRGVGKTMNLIITIAEHALIGFLTKHNAKQVG